MATSELNYFLSSTTDAEFRTWVAALIAQLISVGWVQTTDTGQINTATVLKPTVGAQGRGFAMFRANDGLTEYYLRVDFGSSVNGATVPGIWCMVGFATDGAGSFSGLQKSHQYRIMSTNGAVAPGLGVIRVAKSGDIGSISFNSGANGTTNPCSMLFTVERYRNTSGVAQATGLVVYAGSVDGTNVQDTTTSGASQFWLEAVPQSGGAGGGPLSNNRLPYAAPNFSSSWCRNGSLGVAVLVPWDGGGLPAMLGVLVVCAADFPAWHVPFEATLYGATRTYKYTPCRCDIVVNGYTAVLYQ